MTRRGGLLEAADYLDAVALSVASGWGKHRELFDDGSPCCWLGHLEVMSAEALLPCWVTMLAWEATRHLAGGSFTRFNDAPGRTQNEVIEVCHRAADQLRREVRR